VDVHKLQQGPVQVSEAQQLACAPGHRVTVAVVYVNSAAACGSRCSICMRVVRVSKVAGEPHGGSLQMHPAQG
jgi:hypothetical protein